MGRGIEFGESKKQSKEPDNRSQSLKELSLDSLKMRLPSGENHTELTAELT